ncbi:hypothetical protein [Streptomyces clavuligerus]|uniref:Uncharacterized protein n=1 Tax=Streptomyces clavuligerus TaxID=1901 RepID=B5H0L0_STRCL|nr:hypothetical protein [Streptomyces clavuligerus]ANW18898.1 hypothetical protein BB341_11980 [Streptomyces clavuligerus]AXU13474.1 hypothetical protein D1794_12410 [Streptomyces clavuligerus]EDY52106.1 hypothetical protein SSCG_05174 [Streptomyces clavuligerus]EFG08398.1 Hypothetical protein SCLAV_3327 [Streptomyces clavuligerus]MBY6303432.1 hypothetical protein [Streptomyces clavuligerus]
MTWWLKARRVHPVLTAAFGAFLLLLMVFRSDSVVLPSLVAGSTQVALSLFVPVPLVAGLALCLESRLPAAETTGVRPVFGLDAALAAGVAAVAVAVSALAGAVIGDTVTMAVGRNTLFLTGLMLIARARFGQPGTLLPMAWIMLVCLTGFRPGNDAYPWTVIPEPLGAPHAAAAAVLMFALGLTVQIRSARRAR